MGFLEICFWNGAVMQENAIILVDQPEVGTLYANLYDRVKKNIGDDGRPWGLTINVEAKVQLSGDELRVWREQEKARQLQMEEDARREEEEKKSKQTKEMVSEKMDVDEDVNMDEISLRAFENGTNPSEITAGKPGVVPTSTPSSESVSDYDEKTEEALSAYLAQIDEFSWVRNPAERVLRRETAEKPIWDDYGQVIDTTRFMIGEDPGEGAPEQVTEYGSNLEGDAVETEHSQEIIPTKYVESTVNLQVACKLMFVDCAGLSDGDSVKHLVKKVEPRCVVVIKGTREETEHMRRFLVDSLFSAQLQDKVSATESKSKTTHDDVVCPGLGEVVDITSNTPVQDLIMKESLVRDLQWSQLSGNSIAHLDAVLVRNEENGGYMLDNLSSVSDESDDKEHAPNVPEASGDQQMAAAMDITGKDAELSEPPRSGHPTVFIGTIMLNRLRDSLAKHGLRAEFIGGTLCIENNETGAVVLVKKATTQNIVLDGALCEELFIVRDILYQELVIPI